MHKNRHDSTEAQLILNKVQVHKILIIQIKFLEKKEKKMLEAERYFLMCICNCEAKNDTEAETNFISPHANSIFQIHLQFPVSFIRRFIEID